MRGLEGVAQHYEDVLPADTAEMRKCHDLAQATLERIKQMKFKALIQGNHLTLKPIGNDEIVFKDIDLPKHPDAPKLKIGDLIMESQIRRSMSENHR
jgi:hypothetical protein